MINFISNINNNNILFLNFYLDCKKNISTVNKINKLGGKK